MKIDWRRPKVQPCHKCKARVGHTNIHGLPQCPPGYGCRIVDRPIRKGQEP